MGRRVGAVVAVVAMALGASACSSDAENIEDASVSACTAGADEGKPVAEGLVTNTSSKTSNFSVRVAFYDASDNKITEGVDVVTDVEPATSSPWRVTGLQSVNGPVDCRVSGVTRGVDPGG